MENRTDYSGGRVNTQTNDGGYSLGQHRYFAPDNLFGDAIKSRLKRQTQVQALVRQPQQQQQMPANSNTLGQSNYQDDEFRSAQQRDALLQMQARQNPPPMRGLTGFNMIGSAGGMDVMDTNAMNAYQRAAYLPNNSPFAPPQITGGSPADIPQTQPWDPYAGRRYEGGGAQGPGADYARAQQLAALNRSNQMTATPYQPGGVMRGNYGG